MRRHSFLKSLFLCFIGLAVVFLAQPMEVRVPSAEREEISGLINSLATDDAAFKSASRALVEKRGKAVPSLISALTHSPSPKIRYQAARVLAQIRDERGLDALFQASQLDPDESVRMVARASLDALVELLNTHQPGDHRRRDYERFGRGSIFTLRDRLRGDGSPSVRRRAAQALGEYGDERDLDTLFDAVSRDDSPEVRLEAAKAIVAIAYPILLSGEYRVTFYGTLGYGVDSFRERIVRSLVNLIREEPDSSVRLELLKGPTRLVFPTFLVGEEGFGPFFSLRVRSREVVLRVRNCLLSLLDDDKSPAIRKEAAASLSRLFAALFNKGDRMSNEEMRRTLLTQKRAHYFYPYFPGRIHYFYRRTFHFIPSRASNLLKPVREVSLEAYSSDPDAEVRKEAVLVLSLLGRKSDSAAILARLRSERNAEVQLVSVEALGELGGASAAEALLGIYRRLSNSTEIRKAAAICIGRIGDRTVLRNLAAFLGAEPNRDLKLAISEALGYNSDEQTAAVLTQAFHDRDADVRAAAATAAAGNFSDETLSALKRLLQTDPEEKVRAAACTSLSKALRQEAADIMMSALDDSSPVVRKAAAVELGIRKVEKSADSLSSKLLKDPDASVRAEAATSLGTIGGERSVRPLISAIARDPSPLVREHALQSLLKTDEPRAAIVGILSELPLVAGDNPHACDELNDALLHLKQQAHGRTIGQK